MPIECGMRRSDAASSRRSGKPASAPHPPTLLNSACIPAIVFVLMETIMENSNYFFADVKIILNSCVIAFGSRMSYIAGRLIIAYSASKALLESVKKVKMLQRDVTPRLALTHTTLPFP